MMKKNSINSTIFGFLTCFLLPPVLYLTWTLKLAFLGIQMEDLDPLKRSKANLLLTNIFAIPYRLFIIAGLVCLIIFFISKI